MADLVTIMRADQAQELSVPQARLRAAGIPCVLKNENASGLGFGHRQLRSNVQVELQVPAASVDKACKLLGIQRPTPQPRLSFLGLVMHRAFQQGSIGARLIIALIVVVIICAFLVVI